MNDYQLLREQIFQWCNKRLRNILYKLRHPILDDRYSRKTSKAIIAI